MQIQLMHDGDDVMSDNRELLMLKCPGCKQNTHSYLYADQVSSNLVDQCSGCCECRECGHQFDWTGKDIITKGVKGWKKELQPESIEPRDESM